MRWEPAAGSAAADQALRLMGCDSSKDVKEAAPNSPAKGSPKGSPKGPAKAADGHIVDTFAERRKTEQAAAAGVEGASQGAGTSAQIVDVFAAKRAAAAQAPKVDTSYKNQTGGVCVKQPGELNGAPFNIADCTDCDIFIMDHTCQVFIDRCKNCRIFIGPCESSVFFRNCTDSKFVIAAKQLRCREVKRIELLLFCPGKPIIEKCSDLKLGCFDMSYVSMEQQFDKANLALWNNFWYSIHDFTPNEGRSYTHLPLTTRAKDLLNFDKLVEAVPSLAGELEMQCPVPWTSGPSESADARLFVAAFGRENANFVLQTALNAQKNDKSVKFQLVRTSELDLDPAKTTSLLGKSSRNDPAAKTKAPPVIGFEFLLATPILAPQLRQLATNNSQKLWVAPEDQTKKALQRFFSEYQPVYT